MLANTFYFGIGIGEGAFAEVYPFYALSGIETAPHSHSLYLQILTELGIFGLSRLLPLYFPVRTMLPYLLQKCRIEGQ